ncbi:hypothetical protein [Alicyclobacillus macrosporangiidus]|uniref:Uncharacterized protein n=1 Tax=Alicyclobacillus macrosporangiidus TaxID=392015 RepID=A0A1I7LEM0_9BACL|nr:hypothetical protein [Alicyclobacillus macrosporangiidus]SFV08110.1 hypothetical protein SAMN05421543_14118 [Alicyclobacillus macrosporangiidus]
MNWIPVAVIVMFGVACFGFVGLAINKPEGPEDDWNLPIGISCLLSIMFGGIGWIWLIVKDAEKTLTSNQALNLLLVALGCLIFNIVYAVVYDIFTKTRPPFEEKVSLFMFGYVLFIILVISRVGRLAGRVYDRFVEWARHGIHKA